jgi:hypothetical protein
MINKHKQRGGEVVEFALIAALFFLVLFAAFEFGRALFVWSALTEATRRGARTAAVCKISDDVPIKVALFNDITGSMDSTIINGLDSGDVGIDYLKADGATVTTDEKEVSFIQVSIVNYTHQMFVPYLSQNLLTAPSFKTTLPAESLGARPTYPGADLLTPYCTF